MRFRVTPRRDRGVGIPTKELQKRESFVGELDIFWLRDEARGGYLQVASLRSTDVPSQYLQPAGTHLPDYVGLDELLSLCA